tara:strand:+ start:572 stop:829 length:258 start_codon:yes stop_codon:yes gene_type:complete
MRLRLLALLALAVGVNVAASLDALLQQGRTVPELFATSDAQAKLTLRFFSSAAGFRLDFGVASRMADCDESVARRTNSRSAWRLW